MNAIKECLIELINLKNEKDQYGKTDHYNEQMPLAWIKAKKLMTNVADPVNYHMMVQTLEDMTKIQCTDGNWNYDAYMHGMANGMIFALSLFQKGDPEYLEAPDVWISDIKDEVDKEIIDNIGKGIAISSSFKDNF